MTDDLEGRLDPDSLTNRPKVVHGESSESEEYFSGSNGGLVFPVTLPTLPDPIKVTLMLTFGGEPASPILLDGNLQALSFGHDGWLCTMSTEDKPVIAVALRAAREGIIGSRVMLPDGSIELHTNLDCTASFSFGTASFTVTADEAHYV